MTSTVDHGWVARLDWQQRPPALDVITGDAQRPPSIVKSQTHTVVIEGTLHNRQELLRDLGSSSRDVTTAGMLVHRGYSRWGEDVVRRLRGTFSMVIWDPSGPGLLCARDRLGLRPLFVTRWDGSILAAPLPDDLLRLAEVRCEVNRVVAAARLTILPPPRHEETLLSGISRVPAGHIVRVTKSGQTSARYWNPDDTPREGTAADRAERFGVLLRQAVMRCLDGSQAGVLLSGGLDSATVATAAAGVSRERELPTPWAVSLVFRGLEFDEEQTQRRAAAALDLPHLADPLDHFFGPGALWPAALALAGATCWPPSLLQPPHDLLMERAKRRGCKVLLSGDGGDEWLRPRDELAVELLLRLDVASLLRFSSARYRYLAGTGLGEALRATVWASGIRPLVGAALRRRLSGQASDVLNKRRARQRAAAMPTWLAPDPALRRALLESLIATTPGCSPRDLHRRAKRDLLGDPSVSTFMEETAATERRLGVRFAMPLMDSDLVEFLYAEPAEEMVRNGHMKSMARDYLSSRIFPQGDRWPRAVHGTSLWRSELETSGEPTGHSLEDLQTLSALGIVDQQELSLGLATRGDRLDAFRMFHAVSLERWLCERSASLVSSGQ